VQVHEKFAERYLPNVLNKSLSATIFVNPAIISNAAAGMYRRLRGHIVDRPWIIFRIARYGLDNGTEEINACTTAAIVSAYLGYRPIPRYSSDG
jgi:hypothetical protein